MFILDYGIIFGFFGLGNGWLGVFCVNWIRLYCTWEWNLPFYGMESERRDFGKFHGEWYFIKDEHNEKKAYCHSKNVVFTFFVLNLFFNTLSFPHQFDFFLVQFLSSISVLCALASLLHSRWGPVYLPSLHISLHHIKELLTFFLFPLSALFLTSSF